MNESGIKCVVLMDDNLPAGILANTAAILCVTLGKDASGFRTRVLSPCPYLIKSKYRHTIPLLPQKLELGS